jgi:hypothetical protein
VVQTEQLEQPLHVEQVELVVEDLDPQEETVPQIEVAVAEVVALEEMVVQEL